MSNKDLIKVFEAYKNNCIYRFAICILLIIAVTVLLVFFIKNRNKETKFIYKCRNIIIAMIFILLFIGTLINGIKIAVIAYNLNLDCEEMITKRICGEVTDIYFENKIRFIVIDSHVYILDQVLVGKAYKGKVYCIEYYKNSNFINYIENIETDTSK